MSNRLYIDVHVIETLPPSCVNRDDLGSPKTAVYGGVTRSRVSSQAWKRAVRLEFADMQEEVGERTKHISDLLRDEILRLAPDQADAQLLADTILNEVKIKTDSKTHTNKALFFISPAQVRALADVAVSYGMMKAPTKPKKNASEEVQNAYKAESKRYKEYVEKRDASIKENPSLDVALFGRMLAEDPDLNLDAACQVAHAISTHEVHNEFDYFTAVDDYESAPGAGHLGTMEFNSSTMYRYATVNALALDRYMSGGAAHVVRSFVEAFVRSMPSGKQNSYANRVRPDAVYVTVRKDQPVNMAAAFEKPVFAGKNGFVEPSLKALTAYAQETYQDYYDAPALALVVGNLEELGDKMSLAELLDRLESYVADQLAGKEQK